MMLQHKINIIAVHQHVNLYNVARVGNLSARSYISMWRLVTADE